MAYEFFSIYNAWFWQLIMKSGDLCTLAQILPTDVWNNA